MKIGCPVGRDVLGILVLAAALFAASALSPAYARNASGKGDPEYGAGHTTPHGVKPGRGIFGKPEEHGRGGTSHVPGPKGGHHDDESHSHDSDSHDGGTGHVPGGKGPGGRPENGGHQDESGHEEGAEHDEEHEPGPK